MTSTAIERLRAAVKECNDIAASLDTLRTRQVHGLGRRDAFQDLVFGHLYEKDDERGERFSLTKAWEQNLLNCREDPPDG